MSLLAELMARTSTATPKPTTDPTKASSTTAKPTKQDDSTAVSENIKALVYEELRRMADKIVQEEVEKQIDEKLSGKRITTVQRTRIYKKVLDDVRKRIPDLLEQIAKEQFGTSDDEIKSDPRVSDEIESELIDGIQTLVNRSMERAIADEMFEKVKFEKLSRTPTVEPKLGVIGVRHGQVLMVLLFLAISYIQRADISVAIVAMTDRQKANPNFREFRWDKSIISLLLSSFYWGYFFLQLPAGVLSEKYGSKLIMSSSMVFCSTTALLMPSASLVGDWLGLYALKVLQGISQGTFIPAVYVFTAKWIPPKEKSKLFTPAFGGMQLGTVVGMPICGLLCASSLGWPSTFFFSAIVGYIWVVVWIFVAADSPAVHRSISREEQIYIEGSFGFGEITVKGAKTTIPWRDILTSRPFLALVVAHFGQNWMFSTLLSMMPIYLNDILRVDITMNASLSAIIYLIGWALIVIFGFMAASIHDKQWCSLEKERKIWNSVVVALLTLSMAANSAVYNGLFSNHADLSPNYVGILMGLSNTFGNLSAVLAPLYVGLIVTDKTNKAQWSVVFLTVAVMLIACNTVFLFFGSSEIQSWNTPPDLHLHLAEDTPATFGSSRRRGGRLYVAMELAVLLTEYYQCYQTTITENKQTEYTPLNTTSTHNNTNQYDHILVPKPLFEHI